MTFEDLDDNWVDNSEILLEEDIGIEDGSGGGDMGLYSLSREEVIDTVSPQISFETDFEIGGAVIPGENWAVSSIADQEELLEESEESASGVGGPEMNFYSLSRKEILDTLAPGVSVETSAAIPEGFVSGGNWVHNSVTDGEEGFGISGSGTVFDENGDLMGGSVSLQINGSVVDSQIVQDHILYGSPPPEGVFLGEDIGGLGDDVQLAFIPERDALPIVEDAEGSSVNFDSQYGVVKGVVTDAEGELLENEAVTSTGVTALTDSAGEYEMLAPDGESLNVEALRGSVVEDVSVAGGGETVFDFSYGGIEVQVVDPGTREPSANVRVEIDGELYQTNDGGVARDVQLPPGDYPVRVFGAFEFFASVPAQGSIESINLEDEIEEAVEGSVRVRATDARTGRPVQKMPVELPQAGLDSETGSDGRIGLFNLVDEDEVLVRIGQGDGRYKTEEVIVDTSVEEPPWNIEVEMNRQASIPNL